MGKKHQTEFTEEELASAYLETGAVALLLAGALQGRQISPWCLIMLATIGLSETHDIESIAAFPAAAAEFFAKLQAQEQAERTGVPAADTN